MTYPGSYAATYSSAGATGTLFPLPVLVELLLGGTWTDITQFVMQRDDITITGGRTAAGDTSSPAQLTLTLNNTDGRFSPLYSGGAYYPYLQRNTQIRVSLVNATSASGNVYSGYRFTGEVSEWPPRSDPSGNDVYVSITASGPLRRIRKGGGKGSALARYYATLTGSYAPVAYWPCEEDPDTQILSAGVDGGTDMTVTTGTPKFKTGSFNGSGPVAMPDKSTWDGLTGSFGTSGDDVFSTPGDHTWVASTPTVDCRVWGGGSGGGNGQGQASGGGGEFAREATLAVTPGNAYPVFVGGGGSGGAGAYNDANLGQDGGRSFFQGDSVLVQAHGGSRTPDGVHGGPGGTGSTNTVHHDGGAGAGDASGSGGSGGGSSGGLTAAGNAGSGSTTSSGGAGGAAPSGGGKGGDGGHGGTSPSQGSPGVVPGGAGGAGGINTSSGFGWAGGSGAAGRVELIYTATGGGTLPTDNVVRFMMQTPAWGGNNGKVLLRAFTSGTVARLDVVFSDARHLQLKGYNASSTLLFTGNLSQDIAGLTLLVSAELKVSGANVAWRLACVKPGGTSDFGSVTGTQFTATMGNVTEVVVSPNADVTKTAIGHISVQYAFLGLQKVSKALAGHETEMGVDRFIRLADEQALGNAVEFSEGADHWGFETGTQSWTGTNCALANPATTATGWPAEGAHSLLLTPSGAGAPSAISPAGTSGQPVQPSDIVSATIDAYVPVALAGNLRAQINWYNGAGTYISTRTGTGQAPTAGAPLSLTVSGAAPATAAFFAVIASSDATEAAGKLIYIDNVRIHPQMGPQTRKEYHKFLEEIEDLDQGILKEARDLFGLKYRTRIRLINQSPALILDYTQGTVSPPLEPVHDDKLTKNDISVKRHKGSTIRVTATSGAMSIQEPPDGTGRYRKHLKVAANADEQLAALAQHLLTLGTVTGERYPVITVTLSRASIAGNALAPLMSAVASAEIGDRISIVGLPFWYPDATADQMIIGYTETITPRSWIIQWNCTPYQPYVQVVSQIRRW
ncbi:MAG: hypothetical protein J2P30_00530 [Actinobacteria bacterium]|nr:hypothetical protein [Actinomycetota bacterium]